MLENKAQKLNRLAMEALPEIIYDTQNGGYTFTSKEIWSRLEKKGFVEVNEDIKNDAGACATRATELGMATAVTEEEDSKVMSEENVTNFEIEDVAVVPKRTPSTRRSIYPFDGLTVGQSFFVAATEAKPEPWKSMVSVVASANLRYMVPVFEADGTTPKMRTKTRGPNKGDEVQVTSASRKFAITDDAKDDIKGARIGRVA